MPADYANTVTILTFGPTVNRVASPVVIFNDNIVENNETFFALLDPQGQPVEVDPPREQALVLIVEDVNDSKIALSNNFLC